MFSWGEIGDVRTLNVTFSTSSGWVGDAREGSYPKEFTQYTPRLPPTAATALPAAVNVRTSANFHAFKGIFRGRFIPA